jgi:hypothetical protein
VLSAVSVWGLGSAGRRLGETAESPGAALLESVFAAARSVHALAAEAASKRQVARATKVSMRRRIVMS